MRFFGFILLTAGVLIFSGYFFYGLYQFIHTAPIPLVMKVGIIAIPAGIIVLLISLIRERCKDRKKEKIKEVEK